ncbi:MAG: hypothetical protein GWN53_17210 [Gammaproteobacteria bacterium]|uniref:Rhamnogalacturonase A/B/Epimerase-like pectate lyase domain-containing protein n=1 Tax=Candidatus Kutchimonas denitrificans TaxID=3056748 RepID=A0AAE5CDY3_9BACT|nr:hypothetical protein [Candidatus Kutchimonas denitrificans]NIV53581.1 hypothetical protein [Gammaproteobacteria bacterium]
MMDRKAFLKKSFLGLLAGPAIFGGLADQERDRIYNVVEHGASPDGSHDDSHAIQQAIDHAARTGEPFVFSGGVFHLGHTVTVPRHAPVSFVNCRFVAKHDLSPPMFHMLAGDGPQNWRFDYNYLAMA